MKDLPIRDVADPSSLGALIEALDASDRVGLDTEFHGEQTYIPELMLLQVSTADAIWLVDPLADLDIGALLTAIARPGLRVVGHALRQDLAIFALRWGIRPSEVFDTQAAAAIAGWGRQMGLAPLVERAFGEHLDKGFQRADWSRRPLPTAQRAYAANDARWLLPLHDVLAKALGPRVPWVLSEGEDLLREAARERDPERVWVRVRGGRRMTPREAGVLRAVAAERERLASELDRTPHFLLPDALVLALTEREPTTARAVTADRGLRHRALTEHAERWAAAVRAGLEAPVDEGPRRKAAPEPVAAILHAVREVARELDLDASLLVQRKQAEAAVRRGEGTEAIVEALGLEGWRREVMESRVREALEAQQAQQAQGDPGEGDA